MASLLGRRLRGCLQSLGYLADDADCETSPLRRPSFVERGGLNFKGSEKAARQRVASRCEFHEGHPPIVIIACTPEKPSFRNPID